MQFVILAFGPLGQRARSAACGEAASASDQVVLVARPWGAPRCVFPPELRLALSVLPRAGRLCLHPDRDHES